MRSVYAAVRYVTGVYHYLKMGNIQNTYRGPTQQIIPIILSAGCQLGEGGGGGGTYGNMWIRLERKFAYCNDKT